MLMASLMAGIARRSRRDGKVFADVRRTYSHADPVKVGDVVYTVFNIGGNKPRLITEIFYADRTILVRYVLTHHEYEEEAWKK
jgi:mRNA interferase HigB